MNGITVGPECGSSFYSSDSGSCCCFGESPSDDEEALLGETLSESSGASDGRVYFEFFTIGDPDKTGRDPSSCGSLFMKTCQEVAVVATFIIGGIALIGVGVALCYIAWSLAGGATIVLGSLLLLAGLAGAFCCYNHHGEGEKIRTLQARALQAAVRRKEKDYMDAARAGSATKHELNQHYRELLGLYEKMGI